MGWWIALVVASWLEVSLVVGIVAAAIGSHRRNREARLRHDSPSTAAR